MITHFVVPIYLNQQYVVYLFWKVVENVSEKIKRIKKWKKLKSIRYSKNCRCVPTSNW